MHAQVIKHKEYLASGLFDKCLEKLDQWFVIEVAVDDLPAGLALVGHRSR
jgi:hypothetical protein